MKILFSNTSIVLKLIKASNIARIL